MKKLFASILLAFLLSTSSWRSTTTQAWRPSLISVNVPRFNKAIRSVISTTKTTSGAVDGVGRPSNRGWKSGRLERLTEWVTETQPNRPVVMEYEPSAIWLWRRWRGTVLKLTYVPVLVAIITGFAIDYWARSSAKATGTTWPLFAVPPATEPLIKGLEGVRKLWDYQFTLATFVLTFFLSQAYGQWKKVYNCARCIQGRINDICMLVTLSAKRSEVRNVVNDDNNNAANGDYYNTTPAARFTGYSPEAEKLVKLCTRLIRVSHTFFWAATPTASNGLNDCEDFMKDAQNCPLPFDDEHIGPVLLSPYGLKALISKGQLTKEEAEGLLRSGLPPSEYCYVLLSWVGVVALGGLETGAIAGGSGFEENLLRQLTRLRVEYFDIDDLRAGRMPVAYAHLVQVLVDSLVMLAPFALYPELGIASIPLVGILTLFFKGLLQLSKSFLDPFGVEGFQEQNIEVDVLVSELNFGAGTRWVKAASFLPISSNVEEKTDATAALR